MCPCNFGQWWLFDTIAVTNKGDGKFSFTMPDSKVDVKATFVKSEVKPDQPSKTAFVDVPENSWYADAADFVAQRGLMSGVGENLFGGSQNTTRAMLMTILARMDGQDVTGGSTWYEKAMNWAKANGVSDGTMPEVNITREQLATMLYSYAKLKGMDPIPNGMLCPSSVTPTASPPGPARLCPGPLTPESSLAAATAPWTPRLGLPGPRWP